MTDEKNLAPDSMNGVRQEEEVQASDQDFAFVRVAEVYSPRKVAFDLFLRLGEGRYLKIFRAGEDYSEAELRSYEVDRGVRYVYFAKEHRSTYVNSSLSLLQKVTALPNLPVKTKFGIARILSELYIQQLLDAKEEDLTALLAKGIEICAAIANWIEAQPGLDKFILKLEQIDANTPAHGFLTGLFSCALADRFPWKSKRTNESLLLACFLADLGQSALPAAIAKLKPKRMSSEQKRQFEQHPELSHKILSERKPANLNAAVLTIVREHHEYGDGTGYPRQLTADKTMMLSKVVVLCGDWVRTASDFLVPPGDAARILFPDFTEKLFKSHPELVAKYEKELLPSLFKWLTKEGVA